MKNDLTVNKALDILFWVAVFVFVAVLTFTAIRFKDPVLMVIGAFFIGAGISVKQANDQFGVAIQKYKETGDRFINTLDEAIKEEKDRLDKEEEKKNKKSKKKKA